MSIGFNKSFGWCKKGILTTFPILESIRQWLTPSIDGVNIPDKLNIVSPSPDIERYVLTFMTPDLHEYVDMNTQVGSSDWEFSAIIYASPLNDNYNTIFGDEHDIDSVACQYLRFNSATNSLGMRLHGTSYETDVENTIPVGEWSRVVSKRVSNELIIEAYELDGTLIFSENIGSNSTNLSGNLKFGFVGRVNYPSFKGKCAQIIVNGSIYNCEELYGVEVHSTSKNAPIGLIVANEIDHIRRGTIQTFSNSYLYEPNQINAVIVNISIGVMFDSDITTSSPKKVIVGLSDNDDVSLTSGSSSGGLSLRFGTDAHGIYITDMIPAGYHTINVNYNVIQAKYYISIDGIYPTNTHYGTATQFINHKLSVGRSAITGIFYPIKCSSLSINSETYIDGGTILNSKLNTEGPVSTYQSVSANPISFNLLNGCSVVSNIIPDGLLSTPDYWSDYDPLLWDFDSSGLSCTDDTDIESISYYIPKGLLVKNAYYRMTLSFDGSGDDLYVSYLSFNNIGMALGEKRTNHVMDIRCLDISAPIVLLSKQWAGKITEFKLERLDLASPLLTEPTKSIATFTGVDGVDGVYLESVRLPLNADFNINTNITPTSSSVEWKCIFGQYIVGDIGRFLIAIHDTTLAVFINGAESISTPITIGVEINVKVSRLGDIFNLLVNDVSVGTCTYTGDLTDTDIIIGKYADKSLIATMSDMSVDGLFEYDFTNYIGRSTREIIDISGNGNHGIVKGIISDFWATRLLNESGVRVCSDYYPVNKVGGYIHNGCGTLDIQSSSATSLLDKVTINGVDAILGEVFGGKPSYGLPKSVFWENDHWNIIINGNTIVHPLATGQYPPTVGWPDSPSGEIELFYSMFGINDGGELSRLSISDYLNFINGTQNTLIKWDTPILDGDCHVLEVIRFKQNTTNNWTVSDYNKAIEWCNCSSCGVGFPLLVTHNGVDVVYNSEIIVIED